MNEGAAVKIVNLRIPSSETLMFNPKITEEEKLLDSFKQSTRICAYFSLQM